MTIRHVVSTLWTARFASPVLTASCAALPAASVMALLSLTGATHARTTPAEAVVLSSQWLSGAAETDHPERCQIVVRVVDDGVGVDGATVDLARVHADGVAERWTAHTTARGAHRFIDLPAGAYHLTAFADGRAPQGTETVQCAAHGERSYLELALRAPDTVWRGRVLDEETGAPLPGAELVLQQDMDERTGVRGVARVRTQADGTFTTPMAAGRYTLLVQSAGHWPKTQKLNMPRAASFRSTLRMAPAPHIAGTVVDDAGNAVAGAVVSLGGAFDPHAKNSTTTTDDHGHFSLPVRVASQYVVVARADAKGLVATAQLDGLSGAQEHREVQLQAMRGRQVTGVVATADGTPLAFGDVRFRVRALGMEGKGRLDAHGRFALDGMPSDADVEVWADGNATGAWGAQVASPGNDQLALVFIPPAY